jgi:receptor protein-tyrosine kinase
VAQPAAVPNVPFSPNKRLNVALGMIAGLLAGIGLATLRDRQDKSVKSVQEIEELTKSTVIAQLTGPDGPGRYAGLPFTATDDTLEAYRDLGTHVRFSDVDNPPRSFVITSPTYHEDRANTAINLAIVLGSAEREVALVDADFRSARVTTDFGFNDVRGLSEVLGTHLLDWTLQNTRFPGVTVLPSGQIPPNPGEQLSSQAAEMLFKDLRARFEYVIFDGPPVLPYADTTLVAKQTDGAILIVQPHVTTHEQLVGAVAKLAGVNATLLGVVTTSAPRRGLARRSRRSPKRTNNRHAPVAADNRTPAPTQTQAV